ncbi:MAG TPA: hypothetical protein VKG65_03890, partial [Terriglobales bacterium]|nr:hypothetical protein [Terriglobales bacterium]
DNAPPRIEFLSTKVEGDQVHLTFRAVDSFSPIKRAEYSIDADDWQLVEPVGQISDYKIENYDVNIPIPATSSTETEDRVKSSSGKHATLPANEEHTIIIRVYDRFENVGTGKIVVKALAAAQ